jgi:hypothetical protein
MPLSISVDIKKYVRVPLPLLRILNGSTAHVLALGKTIEAVSLKVTRPLPSTK